ncbi:hypothetical protein HBI56_055110 [Parastagonospora nodorum]|nr:hypothetical protein HBH53_148080 [Parastagonospora nodorum]KAH3967008.1 hypothetical protein HBH51_139490 [Parastagonospora nodorum]KAH3981260.1 hypothetical protein HBH52_084790 [Parastagonospora nodorum]KAH4002934.1 hypothetical protein HBI10_068100 [Parastagonospora nodorum]KAH4028083.1 hypothetical protein HBI13_049930 [Parastagonospora nodorum]
MAIQNSRLQYFLVSFLSILALRYASTSYFSASAAELVAKAEICQTLDQPNPIAAQYPNNATGVLNGTIAVLPISLDLARSLIPSQYRILEHAYRALLPDFPADMYPALVQAVHDHDVQAMGFKIPDFSRAGIEFPFIDLLSDNSTSFKYIPTLFMTAGAAIAIKGAQDYGHKVFESEFNPPCDAYRATSDVATSFCATASDAHVDTTFTASPTTPQFSLDFFKNITNQVMFADGKSCDNMIRLFNTSLSTAPYGIESVRGSVKAQVPGLFEREQVWDGVEGIRFASAFIENNYLPCENFRGYGSA